jgi:hypothetical protein
MHTHTHTHIHTHARVHIQGGRGPVATTAHTGGRGLWGGMGALDHPNPAAAAAAAAAAEAAWPTGGWCG